MPTHYSAAICREQVSSFILGVFFVGGLVLFDLGFEIAATFLDLLVPIEIFVYHEP